MKHLEAREVERFAPPYSPSEVDSEFITYLDRINAKPFVATMQCCTGDIRYQGKDRKHIPIDSNGFWGYIQLLMTCPSATWLCQELRKREWLIVGLSKMWGDDVREMPTYTSNGDFIISLAWDATAWPKPAEDICDLIDAYFDADPEEPPHLLSPDLPRRRLFKKRPQLGKKKKKR